MSIAIPNKSSFKLDEVCKLTGVRPYILRFWESEFDEIRPITSASGQKIYEHKDIVVIMRIKGLLVDRKLSVEKVKKLFAQENQADRQMAEGGQVEEQASEPICDDPPESRPQLQLGIDPSNLQRLVLAKAKLRSIISKTQSLQSLLDRM